jgi:dolichyl-phosphate beta-glucosyltransferase
MTCFRVPVRFDFSPGVRVSSRAAAASDPAKDCRTVTSLVLPAYNPGPLVVQTWDAVCRFLAERAAAFDPWEAVFVLDGCSDGTDDLLARLAETASPRLRVVSYPKNRGKGHAVRTGLLAARGAFRVFTDVDLAYPFADVVRVAESLKAGADVVVASRAHRESQVTLPVGVLGYAFRRHLQSRAFGAVTRLLLPVAQHDTQAGLKGMTAATAERVLPALRCDGFGFDCELLTACSRSGIPVAELPVHVRYDTTASTTGFRTTLRMLRELWQIRRWWRNRSVPIPAPAAEPIRLPRAA